MIIEIFLRLKRKIFLVATNKIGLFMKTLFKPYAQLKISLLPVNYNYLETNSFTKAIGSQWVIVIQGPILNLKHLKYLENNLILFKKNFPGAKIILSSYNQYKTFIDQISHQFYDKKILIDENRFSSNFEKQVASTHYGINSAKKYERKFLLKIRTDQMIHHPYSLNIFESLLRANKNSAGKSKNSIVASSYNSWLYRPFGVSDMLMAGYFEDMKTYWKYDLHIRDLKLKMNKSPTWFNSYNFYYESFLAIRYLIRNNFKFTENIYEDSIRMYQRHVVIIDSLMINQNWFKRSPIWAGNSIIKSGYNLPPGALIEISHADWLAIKFNKFTIKPDNLAARH
jgi:hypothetical protein